MLSFVFTEKPGFSLLGGRLTTNPAGLLNQYTVYHPKTGAMETLCDDSPRVAYTSSRTVDGVVWNALLSSDTQECITLHITASVTGGTVTLTAQVLSEGADFRLVTIRLEGLAAAVEQDPQSRLAMPAHGGRLIDPRCVQDGAIDHRYNWILDSFGSAAIAYTDGLTAVVRVHSMDDQITSRVGGTDGKRYAQLGVLLRHRYTQHDVSYKRATPSQVSSDPKLGTYPVASDFAVGDMGSVTVEFLEHALLPVESGWVPGARRVCESLPEKPTRIYEGYMIYKIFLGSPEAGVRTTYAQAAKILEDVHMRTGGAKQIAYLVGFQNDGHDDRYPDVLTLNTAPGDENALLSLASRARAIGSVVSFHDNYDDAYEESASFDQDIIARDNTGHLLCGGVWNGKQAYWISLPRYVEVGSERRLEKTLARYPFLRNTYHLDVLTASVFRVDFRKGSPSGKQRDLQARLALVHQFRSRGLDVTSEACGLPFIGTMSYFWHMQRVARPLYDGDRRIPMVPFLAHGKADYAGSHTDHPAEILDGLLYGGFFCNDITADTPIKNLLDAYFMLQVPLNLLRDQSAVDYFESDGWKTVTYANGATIAVNFESVMCRVDIGGWRYVENGTAMIPMEDGSTLLYVAWEEPYTPVVMPCGLSAGEILLAEPVGVDCQAVTLTKGEKGLPISLPVGIAYRIHRSHS